MKRLNIDLDGVCAKWEANATLDEVASDGYFFGREPQINLIEALRKLSGKVSLRVLSAAYLGDTAIDDKNRWVDKYMPFVTDRVMIKENLPKSLFMSEEEDEYLLDDYTINLTDWEKNGGIGIKFYNTENNNNGTWEGFVVSHSQNSESIYKNLCAFLGIL